MRCLLFENSSPDLAHNYMQCFAAKGMRLGNPNSSLSSSFCSKVGLLQCTGAQAVVRRAAQRYCQHELILIKTFVQRSRIIR